jgi:mannose-6-phosphate isomerase-like protein (cupin superfamily)
MASSFVIAPKADEAVDNGIVQMNLLVEPGSAEGFAVFVSTFPPLGGGPPAHHHNSYDEAFYVLSGEMEFRVQGETARVPAGSMAWVPRGATHSFRNPCPEPARMLVVTTPNAIDLIIRMPEGLGNPNAMQALFAEHDSHVDGPPLTEVP